MDENYDVVVIGGIGTAVGAAWSGARVLLVERYPFLGGAATISSVLMFRGFFDQRGERVLCKLRDLGGYQEKTMSWTGNRIVLLDTEATKLACDSVTAAAAVDVLLHTTLIDARRRDGRRRGRIAPPGRARAGPRSLVR